MIKLNPVFTFACLLLLFFYTNEGLGKEDTERSEDQLETTPAGSVADNQVALLNYSWRILDTVNDDGTRCRNERCFREGDLIFVAHENQQESQHENQDAKPSSNDELTLIMYDLSSRDIKRFPGMNGAVERTEQSQPTSAQFYFLDNVGQSPAACRKIEITLVRTESTTVSQCSDTLFELSRFNDRDKFHLVFGQACSLDPLIHWRVSDAIAEKCDGISTPGLRSPPESGQGTASGSGSGGMP